MDESDRSSDRTRLLGGLSYFEYQQLLGRDVVIPWLSGRVDLADLRVGDFGAHQGGVLDAFRAAGQVREAVGLEMSAAVVAASPFVGDERFRLEIADVSALAPGEREFDLILMHDVLEHIPNYDEALDAVVRSLGRNGHVFVSFPPYYSAFGGHQQWAEGPARLAPFLHYLPSKLFFRVARTADTEYMTGEQALSDMESVRRTKLTLRRAERAFSEASLEIVDHELFVVRPEYTVRYGWRIRRAQVFGRIAGLREIIVNGAVYLLRRRSEPEGGVASELDDDER